MPGRRDDFDRDDLIRRYLAGESLHEIAARLGVDRCVPRRVLAEAGVPRRNRAEASFLLRKQFPVEAIEAKYLAGVSAKALAREYGVGERVLIHGLRERGVEIRDSTAANTLRFARESNAERLARCARWQWEETVYAPSVRVARPEALRRAALMRAETLGVQQESERQLRAMLPEGWVDGEQVPVDRYNLDLTHGSVAVEVHSSGGYPFRSAPIARRTVDLAEFGWHVVYVWLPRRATIAGTDELVSLVERLDRGPALPRQYAVVWRTGEAIATGHLDPVERTIVPRAVDAS